MKIIKIVLIVLAVIIIGLLITAAFLPSTDKVERSINIKSTPEKIISNISDLRKWDLWSPWNEMDTAAQHVYNDTIGAGGSMTWNGKIMGSGKLVITSDSNSKIDYDLSFFDPFELFSNGTFTLTQENDNTKVTWMNQGKLGYPLGRIMGIFMSFNKMMGPDFEKGLKKLKEYVENNSGYTYEIKEKTVEGFTIAAIRNKVSMADIEKTMNEVFSTIPAYIIKNGANITGPPMAITIDFNNTSWDFEAGFPVNKEIKGNDKIQVKKTYSGKTIYLIYTGPYEKTTAAYEELHKYMVEKKLEQNGGPWEIYITDPSTESDPNKLKTEIYFPVK